MKWKYISDAIFEAIVIKDKLILDLYETREFKRLAFIHHLGVAYFFYPCATHTRLVHSLGAYELARRCLEHIEQQIEVSKTTHLAVLAAALLHDIGHGPMSHLFESISTISHEEMGKRIILSEETEIGQVFKKYDSKILEEVIQIFEKKHPQMWTSQLISSQIDVDRLDYLLRDSYVLGRQSKMIDWVWLIKNIIIIDNKLTFHVKAIASVEALILTRYHMNQKVYRHPKTMAFSRLYYWFFNRLRYLVLQGKISKKYAFVIQLFKGNIGLEFFQILDDHFVFELIKQVQLDIEDTVLLKIADAFLKQKIIKLHYTTENIVRLQKEKPINEKGFSWEIINKKVEFHHYFDSEKDHGLIYFNSDVVKSVKTVSSIFAGLVDSNLQNETLGLSLE